MAIVYDRPIYRSGDLVKKMYRSGELIYLRLQPQETKPDYSKQPLTFKVTSGGTIVWSTKNISYTTTIEYKLNNGSWVPITSNTGTSAPSISVSGGDTVQFRGDNASYATTVTDCNYFIDSTAKFVAEGNIMSLIDSIGFTTATTLASDYTFYSLFTQCAGLTSAENLVLPVTTLTNNCYENMFWGCTGLTTAPELPATTLADRCYAGMFNGCTGLTTAPDLPATTLAVRCYRNMFYGCTSLNYIKCLATNISASNCTNGWVNGVSSTGTFVKDPNTTWPTGKSGIPSGWTVLDAE